MAPLCSAKGFVADVHSVRITARHRRRNPNITAARVLTVTLLISMSLLAFICGADAVERDSLVRSSQSLAYEFRVYALNQTYLARTPSGTAIGFNSADLPFAFSTISFGDYRMDTDFSDVYYGGSGILVSAGGGVARMALKETNGKLVSNIDYHGQAQVVFNGRMESVTYPSTTTTYNGTDQMVQDWRNGLWTPDDGVIIEHPSNVTLTRASFYLMTLEPNAIVDIPEFEFLMPVLIGPLITLYARRRNSAVKE